MDADTSTNDSNAFPEGPSYLLADDEPSDAMEEVDPSNAVSESSPWLAQLTPTETQYRCPGEVHSISRAVHLSRLAAFYPACRECQHRTDTGELPAHTVERIQQVERRVTRKSIFHQNGIRGVYLNDISTDVAARIASAFARVLWDEIPLCGTSRRATRTARIAEPSLSGPVIVVGYDERPSSPAILSAVIDALRFMSCQVVDVGLVSRSCFCFAVDHLQAGGGFFVTGAGHEASWTGLDLVGRGAITLSQGEGLDEIERRYKEGVSRPTRRAAYQRSFQAHVPYEAGLWKHFHALRPLKVVIAARPRPVRQTLRRLFKKLPCQIIEVPTTTAVHAHIRPETLAKRLPAQVRKCTADVGILIHDDGCRIQLFDEQAREIPVPALTRLFTQMTRRREPRASIVMVSEFSANALENPEQEEALVADPVTRCANSFGAIGQKMKDADSALGIGQAGRFWFRESYPACDAILTLARVLETISLNNKPLSRLIKSD